MRYAAKCHTQLKPRPITPHTAHPRTSQQDLLHPRPPKDPLVYCFELFYSVESCFTNMSVSDCTHSPIGCSVLDLINLFDVILPGLPLINALLGSRVHRYIGPDNIIYPHLVFFFYGPWLS